MTRARKPLRFLAALGVLGLFARDAHAAGERVIVMAPADDERTGRLVEELRALSFDPVTSITTICAASASDATMCVDGDAIRIWIHGEARPAVSLVDANGAPRTLVEVQAVEIVRAGLRTGEATATTVVPPAPPPPIVVPQAPPVASEDRTEPTPPARHEGVPRFALSGGFGALASRESAAFTAEIAAQMRLARWLSLVARTDIPLKSSTVFGYSTDSAVIGTASVRPALASLGVVFPILPIESRFGIDAGAGAAVVWLHVAPESAGGAGAQTHSQDLFAPAVYGRLEFSYRLLDSFALVASGSVGGTGGQFIVEIGRQSATAWGLPFFDASLSAAWVIQ